MDHGPVPVRTAVQPSFVGQGRPGRNAFSMHFPNESILTEKKRQGKGSFPLALQTVKKLLGGVGGAAAPLTFIRIRRLCRRGGLLILPAKSIPYKFGRPLVGRICFLAKVVPPLLRHAGGSIQADASPTYCQMRCRRVRGPSDFFDSQKRYMPRVTEYWPS